VDSRSRVEAALQGGKVDRPPAAAWGHTYREEWSPGALARVTAERVRRYGWDFVKFQPRASCFAEAFGATYQSANHALRAPTETSHPIHGFADWPGLPAATAAAPSLAEQVEALRLTVREVGPEVPVIQTVFSPISVGGYLVGKDKRRAVRDLRRQPESVLPALERIADTMIDFSRRSLEAGAAGIFYAISGYASAGMLTAEEYDRWLFPLDERILRALPKSAWFNVLHLCRGRLHFDIARRLPVQAVSWSVADPGNPSLAEGRKLSGKAVMGGLGQRTTLYRGTPEEVVREARAALHDTGGIGFLLAPGCSVPPGARTENMVAMMSAVAA
jgi:uroporphyrinogen decarboxylase